jgi:predicted TIM-barrel fold metal-dependent hydrolase
LIVDVDTHWEATRYADGGHPLEPWLDRLPRGLDSLAFAVAGDLLAALPESQRPSPAELLPRLVARAKERGGPVVLHPRHDSSADERVAWMDRVGIDHCLVNPGGYWQLLELMSSDRAAGARRCNDFLTDQLSGHANRLHAVAVLDFTDLDASVAELERARSRGARAFFLYTVRGRPPGPVSPGHPAWDRVWAAATALGMVAVVHVGNTSSDFAGWADIGWNLPGGAGVGGLVRLANTQRIHAAQNLLSALLYGGVFARHPTLTVLLAELRAGWVPPFVEMLDRQSRSSPALGDWPWELSGDEMLRRNVRLTPLPGFGDADALDVLAQLPDMCVFSSDYPHQEGNVEPIELYRPGIDALDDAVREWFLGGNVAECYARTGDPLPGRGAEPTELPARGV